MNTHPIRELIEEAKRHEQTTLQFKSLIDELMDDCSSLISIPADCNSELLYRFACDYIEQSVVLLEQFSEAARKSGTEDFVYPFLEVARSYLRSHKRNPIMEDLLDDAYLIHRVAEEINDISMAASGVPLVKLNSTWDSLIIHTLLGEDFANQLDFIVEDLLAKMNGVRPVFTRPGMGSFAKSNPFNPLATVHSLADRNGLEMRTTPGLY
ncbi:hypothetical protein [Spongorhabdus nitratireducens]